MNVNISIELDEISILYVEDNPGDLVLVEELLNIAPAFNFTLRAVTNLEEARIQLQKYKVDVLLLDLNLGETKGIDTIDEAVVNIKHVPILLLTEFKDMGINYYASSRGIMGYLVKGEDYTTDKLIRAILMAKVHWDVEQEKINQIKKNLLKSEDKLNSSQMLLEDTQDFLKDQIYELSHKIRGPLCTIEGLMNVLEMDDIDDAARTKLLIYLRTSFEELKSKVDVNIGELETKVSQKIEDHN